MTRKLLVVLVVLALFGGLAPAARAGTNLGVIVFVGGADVGDRYFGGPMGSPGAHGLCYPGFSPTITGSCVLGGPLTGPLQEWELDIPGRPWPAPFPASFCWAIGAFSNGVGADPDIEVPGNAVNDLRGNTFGNCAIQADGNVGGSMFGIGPSCGMSGGESRSGQADHVVLGGVVRPLEVVWKMSPGGTLILDGVILDPTDPDDPQEFLGLVHARPLPPENCQSVAARVFNIVGVIPLTAVV